MSERREGATGAASPRWRRAAGIVGLLLGGVLVAGMLAEGALRLLAVAGNRVARRVAEVDPFAIKVEPHGAFGYRQRPGAVLVYANGTRATANRQGFRGPDVAVPKRAGTFRIVLLGESSTHGWYVNDGETIDTYLRDELQAARPDLRIDVVNLAYDGYDAYQMWQRLLDDGVPLQPDLVVVNAGVNDVRNAQYSSLGDPDPRTLVWKEDLERLREDRARGGPTFWTRLKHVSFLARFPGAVRGLLASGRAGGGGGGGSATRGPYPAAADNFTRNVQRIASVAHDLGAALVLSTPPSALLLPDAPRSMPPRGYWIKDAATTQAYRDTLAARLRALASTLTAGGQRVTYIAPRLPGSLFLDDVHLTSDGNRAVARAFATAINPFLPSRK